MKVTKLAIKNVGKIAHTEIELNKPLILFYGEIRQGKTTILNAVRWVCGGEFPQDIISHGEKEASVELSFDGGMISRSWYRAKDETTKARPVMFVKNGKPVSSPVSEIKRLLNPYLLDQDFLRNKTELERKQYFTELFAVDTTELDKEQFDLQREAQALRAKISGYGEINLTVVEPVNAMGLQEELAKINQDHVAACSTVNAGNKTIALHNATVQRGKDSETSLIAEVADLTAKLNAVNTKLAATKQWLAKNPAKTETPLPTAPDVSELQKKIQDAGATNVRAEQYQANKKRAGEKSAEEAKLQTMESRQREIKAEKQKKLQSVSETCGIADLSFDEAGNFIYQGTTAGMISDSQIMRLSSELSALYPDGFGLDLIDRGESLGKSIFEFVERAKKEDKTILATIVGERPATVPENIGVFVVENGQISK